MARLVRVSCFALYAREPTLSPIRNLVDSFFWLIDATCLCLDRPNTFLVALLATKCSSQRGEDKKENTHLTLRSSPAVIVPCMRFVYSHAAMQPASICRDRWQRSMAGRMDGGLVDRASIGRAGIPGGKAEFPGP